MKLPNIVLPTRVEPLPVSRLATGVRSKVTGTLHECTWRGLLQDLADTETHPDLVGESTEWYGLPGPSFEADKGSIAKLALHGWTEAADACRVLFRQVTARHTSSFLQTVVPTDEPGDVDVGAYLADADMQFTTATASRQHTLGSGGIVTLEHELFSSALVPTKEVVARGLIAAAAVYMMERAGTRVEVYARLTGSSFKDVHDHRIKVKKAGDPLHVGRLLYWLAHPSVHRVILLAVRYRFWGVQRYRALSMEPIKPHYIRTPNQVAGTSLETWLAETLTRIGLTFK